MVSVDRRLPRGCAQELGGHSPDQSIGSERLLDHGSLEADRALQPEIFHRVAGHEEDRKRRPAFPQTPSQLDPADSRHHQIGQDQIGLPMPIQSTRAPLPHPTPGGPGSRCAPGSARQSPGPRARLRSRERLLRVARLLRRAGGSSPSGSFRRSTTSASDWTGRYSVKVAPRPGALATVMYPLFCFMMPSAAARPSPVPLPTGLVVKNGSKTCVWVAASMPMPVSRTTTSA